MEVPPPPPGVISNWYASLTIPLAFYGYYGQPDYSFIALIYISVVLNCQEIAGYELIKSGCLLSRIPVKTEISKFFIIMQVEKKPFGETFWKIMYQSFQRAFKAHGRKKRFKETSSSLAGKYRHPGQLQYYLVKNIARWCILYSTKKSLKFPIFSTFINNENLQNFEEKKHGLVGILEYIYTSEKYSIIKNQAWAIEKQLADERGKRAVHFQCFFIKCWNRHATGNKTNPMKSLWFMLLKFFWSRFKGYMYKKISKGSGITKSFNNFAIGGSKFK